MPPAPAPRCVASRQPIDPLWYGEVVICLCVIASLCLSLILKLGWSWVGGDVFQVILVAGVCASCEQGIQDCPMYRRKSGHGLTVGCLTIPAVLCGLMLWEASNTTMRSAALAWNLRMAVSASALTCLEAMVGLGKGTRMSAILRPAGLATGLAFLATARFPGLPWGISLVTLLVFVGLFKSLLLGCARSFTLGEAAAISSALALLGTDTSAQVLAAIMGQPNVLTRTLLPVDSVVQSLIVGTLLTSLSLWPWISEGEKSSFSGAEQQKGTNSDADKKKDDDADKSDKNKGKDSGYLRENTENVAMGASPQGKQVAVGGVKKQGERAEGNGGSRTFHFFLALAVMVGFVCMPAATLLVKNHMLLWVGEHVMESRKRLALLAYWGAVLLCSLAVYPPKSMTAPKIVIRKGFHVIAMALFAPGQHFEPETMRLAYAACFALFVTLELMRAARIGAPSEKLHQAVAPLLDERDFGTLILTHIYLLVGCAVPSLLCAGKEPTQLAGVWGLLPYAGVLVLGVGDTAASVVGTYLGRTFWIPSEKKGKTVEGTVAGWICTVGAALALMSYAGVNLNAKVSISVALATASACLLEAFTQQIDNLFLPAWYFAMLVLAAVHSS